MTHDLTALVARLEAHAEQRITSPINGLLREAAAAIRALEAENETLRRYGRACDIQAADTALTADPPGGTPA